ncbi:MAG: hypothetical protein ABGX25_05720 [Nautiliaceae bacterium]
MKRLILFLLFFTFLFGNMKELLLIESKLYPKIVRLDKSLKDKEQITFAILYEESEKENAYEMAKLLKKQGINVKIVPFSQGIPNADAYVLIAKKICNNTLNNLLKKRKLIFGVYPQSIEYSIINVYIGVKIKPLINPYLLKKAKISLSPIIFKVAKIYEK